MEGWISLHRKFLDWQWFDNSDMVKLFIYLLLKANHSENTWKGINIKRGQLITGLEKLNKDTKISYQKLRTCLSRIQKTGEINMQVTNKYRIITICKYDEYQTNQQATNKQTNKQLTSNQQATNKQLTTNNNVNNVNNDNNKVNFDFGNLNKEIWTKWITYKKEQFKFKYKSNSSEQIGIKNLIKLSGNDNKIAEEIINQSIGNGWEGLFPLKKVINLEPEQTKQPYANVKRL